MALRSWAKVGVVIGFQQLARESQRLFFHPRANEAIEFAQGARSRQARERPPRGKLRESLHRSGNGESPGGGCPPENARCSSKPERVAAHKSLSGCER